VVLSTIATIIASQAVISGAFSITHQLIQLGFSPRLDLQHTSAEEVGQIYLPAVNWLLLIAIIALVLGFKSSSALAAAYGIAVTGTMLITNIIAAVVAIRIWKWSPWSAVLGATPFMVIDLAFFSANTVKIADGGWFPLAFGFTIVVILMTWKRGREILENRLQSGAIKLEPFLASLVEGGIHRIPGLAVFMTSHPSSVPNAMLHSLKHYKSLHEQVIVLSVEVHDVPYLPASERIALHQLSKDFAQVTVHYGYKDEPNIPLALEQCDIPSLKIDLMDTSFFLGRETLIPKLGSDMAYWRELLFIAMFRNASSAMEFFKIPSNRVVELGSQIVL
jgi:KUP system potassium uptake protein